MADLLTWTEYYGMFVKPWGFNGFYKGEPLVDITEWADNYYLNSPYVPMKKHKKFGSLDGAKNEAEKKVKEYLELLKKRKPIKKQNIRVYRETTIPVGRLCYNDTRLPKQMCGNLSIGEMDDDFGYTESHCRFFEKDLKETFKYKRKQDKVFKCKQCLKASKGEIHE